VRASFLILKKAQSENLKCGLADFLNETGRFFRQTAQICRGKFRAVRRMGWESVRAADRWVLNYKLRCVLQHALSHSHTQLTHISAVCVTLFMNMPLHSLTLNGLAFIVCALL
jgi:hypothetical protein